MRWFWFFPFLESGMQKSTFLSLALAMCVPVLALAEGGGSTTTVPACSKEAWRVEKATKNLDSAVSALKKPSARYVTEQEKLNKDLAKIFDALGVVTKTGTTVFDSCKSTLQAAGKIQDLGAKPTLMDAVITGCSKDQQKSLTKSRNNMTRLTKQFDLKTKQGDAKLARLKKTIEQKQKILDASTKSKSDAEGMLAKCKAPAKP